MVPQNQNRNSTLVGRALIVVLLAVSLVSMTVYSREGEDGILHSIQDSIEATIAPLKFVGAGAGSVVGATATGFTDLTADANTLSGLKEQNAELRELLIQTEEYRLEAQRLQSLLGLSDAYEIKGVAGRVIGRTTDAWNQTVTLDVGSNSGVTTGLTVMGPSGVIGQVISVAPASCSVRLITDPQSGVAAMIQSSRAEGIVRGSLEGLLYLENVGADVEIEVGDVVLTSGLGGSYIQGLLVGTIARIEGSIGDATRRIVVSPNSSTGLLEEAIVVFSADNADRGSSTQLQQQAEDAEDESGEAGGLQGSAGSSGSSGSGSTSARSSATNSGNGEEGESE